MAELTEQIGNQVLKVGGNFVKSAAEFIDELLKAIEKNRTEDPNKYTIGEHMKNGGQVYMSQVRDEFVADMKRHLTEQNVAFIFLDNGDGDNCKTLIIRDTDKAKAEFATKLVFAEHGQNVEFEKDEIINMVSKDKLACVAGLAEHEYELFRIKARDNGLKFAATVGENNKINILYSTDEKDRLDSAMRQMAWNLTGRNGDEYETAFKTRAEAQEHIRLMHKKKAKPIYLVDAKHPDMIIKVEKTGVTFCQQYDDTLSKESNFENAMQFSVADKGYITRLGEMLAKFEEPVAITEKEFRDREAAIAKKLPKLDKEFEDKELPYLMEFEKQFQEHGAKMSDKFEEVDFSFTSHVEEEIEFEEGIIPPDFNEKKEIDAHVKETVTRVKTYEYYQPKSNVLLKHLEDIKKKRTIEQAKRKEENEKGKEAVRESKKKDYRDR